MDAGEHPQPAAGTAARPPTIALVLSVAAAAMVPIALFGDDAGVQPVTVVASLVGLVPWALVAGGVRFPLLAFGIWTCTTGATAVIVDTNPGGVFPLLVVLVYVSWATDSWWIVGAALACTVASITVLAVLEDSASDSGFVYFYGGTVISLVNGRLLRRQTRLMEDLGRMQELRLEHAAVEERTRIAREVHDVVAHSLTVVMLHLTGARRVISRDPARADAALAKAETVGRESLDSIRQVVGLLRAGDAGAGAAPEAASLAGAGSPASPQPGFDQIAALNDDFRAAGVDVSATVDLAGVTADAAIQLVVYRVVQESLSNVLQHAPGAAAAVRVWTTRDEDNGDVAGGESGTTAALHLHVEVVNAGPPVMPERRGPMRPGLGVRGMRERVLAAGGSFEAGPTGSGGWQVAAALPLRAATIGDQVWTASPAAP